MKINEYIYIYIMFYLLINYFINLFILLIYVENSKILKKRFTLKMKINDIYWNLIIEVLCQCQQYET